MKKKILVAIFFVAAIASAVFAYLTIIPNPSNPDLPPYAKDIPNPPAPDRTIIDVYFDATYSMRGYTTLAAGNVYRELPDFLNSLNGSIDITSEVKFYRFGENVAPVNGSNYRRFGTPDAYTESVAAIDKAIDKTNTEHLSIIVTNLFEGGADWSTIADKIRKRYFNNHLAVAVIGIKNSFNGEIFNAGPNAENFNYNSNAIPERFRPFYLLIMGKKDLVGQCINKFQEWQALSNFTNETHCLLLSENLMTALRFKDMNPPFDMDNLYRSNKRYDTFKVEDYGADEFEFNNPEVPASFSVQFDYNAPPDGFPINMSHFNTTAKVFCLDEVKWVELNKNDVRIELSPVDGTENSYALKIEFTPNKILREGKVNFVQILITPPASGYMMPAWVRAWNSNKSDNPNGATTVNLANIINKFKDSIIAMNPPALVNLEFLVESR